MLDVRSIEKMRNERFSEVCNVKKSANEEKTECELRWFGHMWRMNDNNRLVK